MFGSCGINVLNTFYDANEKYRDSDENRQQFAKHALKNYRFIYRTARGDNIKVHIFFTYSVQAKLRFAEI
jgi:hypothetical protein